MSRVFFYKRLKLSYFSKRYPGLSPFHMLLEDESHLALMSLDIKVY